MGFSSSSELESDEDSACLTAAAGGLEEDFAGGAFLSSSLSESEELSLLDSAFFTGLDFTGVLEAGGLETGVLETGVSSSEEESGCLTRTEDWTETHSK